MVEYTGTGQSGYGSQFGTQQSGAETYGYQTSTSSQPSASNIEVTSPPTYSASEIDKKLLSGEAKTVSEAKAQISLEKQLPAESSDIQFRYGGEKSPIAPRGSDITIESFSQGDKTYKAVATSKEGGTIYSVSSKVSVSDKTKQEIINKQASQLVSQNLPQFTLQKAGRDIYGTAAEAFQHLIGTPEEKFRIEAKWREDRLQLAREFIEKGQMEVAKETMIDYLPQAFTFLLPKVLKDLYVVAPTAAKLIGYGLTTSMGVNIAINIPKATSSDFSERLAGRSEIFISGLFLATSLIYSAPSILKKAGAAKWTNWRVIEESKTKTDIALEKVMIGLERGRTQSVAMREYKVFGKTIITQDLITKGTVNLGIVGKVGGITEIKGVIPEIQAMKTTYLDRFTKFKFDYPTSLIESKLMTKISGEKGVSVSATQIISGSGQRITVSYVGHKGIYVPKTEFQTIGIKDLTSQQKVLYQMFGLKEEAGLTLFTGQQIGEPTLRAFKSNIEVELMRGETKGMGVSYKISYPQFKDFSGEFIGEKILGKSFNIDLVTSLQPKLTSASGGGKGGITINKPPELSLGLGTGGGSIFDLVGSRVGKEMEAQFKALANIVIFKPMSGRATKYSEETVYMRLPEQRFEIKQITGLMSGQEIELQLQQRLLTQSGMQTQLKTQTGLQLEQQLNLQLQQQLQQRLQQLLKQQYQMQYSMGRGRGGETTIYIPNLSKLLKELEGEKGEGEFESSMKVIKLKSLLKPTASLYSLERAFAKYGKGSLARGANLERLYREMAASSGLSLEFPAAEFIKKGGKRK